MKKKMLAVMMLVAGSAFAETHFSIGVGIGTPGYAPAPYAVAARPPFPGPGFVWIDGYYDAYGRFIPGYWARPPYEDSFWVAPTFFGGHFTTGYWGRRGVVENRFRNDFRNDYRGRSVDHDRGFHGNAQGHDRGRGNGSRR